MHNDSCVVVLGATGGIGRAVVQRLVAAKHQVFAVARDTSKLQALENEFGVSTCSADASTGEGIQTCFHGALAEFGAVSGAVNCIGSLLLKPAHLTTEQEWNAVMTANLTTAFLTVREGVKAMIKTGGSIVLLSSAAGQIGLANHEAIAAAKAGIIGLARSAAATYASRGIRVNCVCPGLVSTPMTERITGNETSRKASESMHPMGRLGDPKDIASAIAWFLDAEQSWVTGQALGVDGGLGTLKVMR